jgi:cytoskeletal protein CcmA (bactofilin family)
MSMFDKRKDAEPPPQTTGFAPPPPEPRVRTPEAGSRSIAVIGKTITINGDVIGEESLVIDGKVEGTVRLNGYDLTVGQSGRVKASIAANVVRIEGEVSGDIAGIEKVVITKTGRVRGNIVAQRVTLEDGSNFKGSIDMNPAQPVAQAAPQMPKSEPGATPLAVASRAPEAIGKA